VGESVVAYRTFDPEVSHDWVAICLKWLKYEESKIKENEIVMFFSIWCKSIDVYQVHCITLLYSQAKTSLGPCECRSIS
jgi:hypothetical protein